LLYIDKRCVFFLSLLWCSLFIIIQMNPHRVSFKTSQYITWKISKKNIWINTSEKYYSWIVPCTSLFMNSKHMWAKNSSVKPELELVWASVLLNFMEFGWASLRVEREIKKKRRERRKGSSAGTWRHDRD